MIANNQETIANESEIDDAENALDAEPVGVREDFAVEDAAVSPSGCSMGMTQVAILESLTELKATLTSQGEVLAELGQRDALLGKLHERLAAYEQDERSRSFLEPLARKAAPLHRRLKEQAGHARSAVESLPQALRQASPYYWAYRSLEATRAELETLLADFGIETFMASGSGFDRRCQEAVERISAQSSHKPGEIARRIAPGFRIDGRIVVAERVAVYVAQVGRRS